MMRILVMLALASGCVGGDPATSDVGTGPVELSKDSPAIHGLLEEGYQWIPGGWLYHPDCIHVVPDGARVDDGRVVLLNGDEMTIPPCDHPRYLVGQSEVTLAAAAPEPGETNDYVESRSYTNTTGHLTKIAAYWTVPAEPTWQDGQTIYMFPGLQGTQNKANNCILQPVLQWGNGATSWRFASFCVGLPSGGVAQTGFSSVVPGQAMHGIVSSSSCNSSWSLCDWTVQTCAVNANEIGETCHSLTRSSLDPVDYAMAGALEAYNVTNCNHYPASGSITFSSVSLYRNGASISPTYAGHVKSALLPACGFSTSQSGSSVTLAY